MASKGKIGSHLPNILDLIPIPNWRNIKRGMLIRAKYTGKTGKSELKFYLVLDPYWPKASGKMHVLDLDYIHPEFLGNRLIKYTINKVPLEETWGGRTYTRLEFDNDEAAFYDTVIKRLVNDGFGPSYRTIFPQNLHSIKIIHYEWFDNKDKEKQGETKPEQIREEEEKRGV